LILSTKILIKRLQKKNVNKKIKIATYRSYKYKYVA